MALDSWREGDAFLQRYWLPLAGLGLLGLLLTVTGLLRLIRAGGRGPASRGDGQHRAGGARGDAGPAPSPVPTATAW